MSKDITHAIIVPLIGGQMMGMMDALGGKLPEYILSYPAFQKNDAEYINYLRTKKGYTGDYIVLDEDTHYKTKQVDIISTTCPCAGLSSLSVSSSADSAVNDWLYKTADHVLKTIKPKVFWGENAPRLFTSAGKPVADKLHKIGIDNGYTLTLYYTESRLHGLSQKRPRTFYFFCKGNEAPLFDFYHRDWTPVENILKMDLDPNDPMNVLINKEDPTINPWVAYSMYKAGANTLMDLYNSVEKSTNLIVNSDTISDSLHDVADWMESNGFEKVAGRARAMQGKLDEGKGYWAHGVTMPKGQIPALIGALPHSLINPFKNQYLTVRDCLRLMSMPDDFDMFVTNPGSPGNANMICQNVPVSTARDMGTNIVKYLNGECQTIPTTYLKQNNVSKKVEVVQYEMASLEEFFG